MRLLIFAHTPPPHHGQSYMVQLMLQGLGGDCRHRVNNCARQASSGLECYHVNARLSQGLEDIGDFRFGKLVLLMGYCLQAIWCRFRYGIRTFYYVPAPGKRSALYRDWLVLLLCRPFFSQIILHWHASGLGKWLETQAQIRSRSLTYKLAGHADLSIVLTNYGRVDAEKLFARRVVVVGNGIPDPCPDFDRRVLPRRKLRAAARQKLCSGQGLTAGEHESAGSDLHLFRVLFLAHCTREKGLFDALEGVALANRKLTQQGSPLRMHLTVAGEFINAFEQSEFQHRIQHDEFQLTDNSVQGTRLCLVQYKGFVTGPAKAQVFEQSDCFCFPTSFYAESFGLVVVEAMAFGLPVVASRWRSLPELMPSGDSGIVPPKDPEAIANALLAKISQENFSELRAHFLARFTLDRHFSDLAKALKSVNSDPVSQPRFSVA